MSDQRYAPEFKDEAVRQVIGTGHSVGEVAERDIPKKDCKVLCQRARVKYRSILERCDEFRILMMCHVLRVHPSGYYPWIQEPLSDRAIEHQRLLTIIRLSYASSGGVYGARRVVLALREMGEARGIHRVEKIMRVNKVKALRGSNGPGQVAGRPSIIAANKLQREFTVALPNRAWVTDITYVRTCQGWLYFAVVIDLYSRIVIDWSMKPSLARSIVLDALMLAVWRPSPKQPVIVHFDQGSQYGSDEWLRFCQSNNIKPSMSRRGNCWDDAVAEAFFGSLKK